MVIEVLDEEEKQIWGAIQNWLAIFPKKAEEDDTVKKKKKQQKTKEFNLRENFVILIDSINKTLSELKNELEQ